MAEPELVYSVRHRKYLSDWSKVIILCDNWDDALDAVVQTMNSSDTIAEVDIYDPFASRTVPFYPKFDGRDQVKISKEDVK